MAETFGHSKNLYTLSQVLTYNNLYIVKYAGARVNIRLSLQKCKGGQFLLLHPHHALLKNSCFGSWKIPAAKPRRGVQNTGRGETPVKIRWKL